MSGTAPGQVSDFTVNGQRPNSNNMTIDGVANIDTGDNGGNMATTNIDAVAEFKILTNAYQAEYGRAVGGQVQVVTKSGTQAFHGSGYWYGRNSDWNANSWTNKRAAAPAPVGSRQADREGGVLAQRPRLHDRRPGLHPRAASTPTRGSCSSSGARSSRAGRTRSGTATPACRPRSSAWATSRRASTAAATPIPYIRDYRTGLPCSSADTRGCFQDGGVARQDPREPHLGAGPGDAQHLPDAQLHGAAAASTTPARSRTTGRGART